MVLRRPEHVGRTEVVWTDHGIPGGFLIELHWPNDSYKVGPLPATSVLITSLGLTTYRQLVYYQL